MKPTMVAVSFVTASACGDDSADLVVERHAAGARMPSQVRSVSDGSRPRRYGGGRMGRSSSISRAVVSLALVGVSACGGSKDAVDAAADAGSSDGSVVASPDIPWLEDGVPAIGIAPCPDGWREVADDRGATTCDPYPEGGAADCPRGQAHFPGEPGCSPVGSSCPAGDFAESLPADRRIVYVQPGATGGDGMSPGSAYGSLAEFALGALPSGTIIALSRGTHQGPVRITRRLGLRGACAAETVLTTDEPSEGEAVVTLRNASGEVRDLTVADSPRGGIWMFDPTTEGELLGLVIATTETVALACTSGSRLTANSVVVRDTRSSSRGGVQGGGLEAQLGATAAVTRAIFARNRRTAVLAGDAGTELTITDVVARDTEGQAGDGSGGRGLGVQTGATAVVTRSLFERNRELGVFVGGADAAVMDVVVRETRSETGDGSGGRGLEINRSAGTGLTRALIEENRDVGVVITWAAVTVSDIGVRDTRSREHDGTSGRGLTLGESTAVLDRALLERNRHTGLYVGGAGAAVTISDVVVRDTESVAIDEALGRGFNLEDGATAELTRGLLERNREIGVFAGGTNVMGTLRDVIVRDTSVRACARTSCPESPAGHGAGSVESASLSMDRFVISRAEACGLLLASDGELDLSEGEVNGCPIGACVQVEGYDLDRLTDGVRFTDNESNLQATTLPVPEPTAPPEGL